MSAAAPQTIKAYRKILARELPMTIKSEEDNERALAKIEKLMRKGQKRTAAETVFLELMVRLISDFEENFYKPENAQPHEVLRELMNARGVSQADLVKAGIFSSSGIASEVTNGKRDVSKAQAKALAEFFNISADLFI